MDSLVDPSNKSTLRKWASKLMNAKAAWHLSRSLVGELDLYVLHLFLKLPVARNVVQVDSLVATALTDPERWHCWRVPQLCCCVFCWGITKKTWFLEVIRGFVLLDFGLTGACCSSASCFQYAGGITWCRMMWLILSCLMPQMFPTVSAMQTD